MGTLRRRFHSLSCVLAAVSLLGVGVAATPAVAVANGCGTTHWNNTAVSGNWDNPSNWDTNLVPTATDAVCLPAGIGSYTVTLPADDLVDKSYAAQALWSRRGSR